MIARLRRISKHHPLTVVQHARMIDRNMTVQYLVAYFPETSYVVTNNTAILELIRLHGRTAA